MQSCRNGTEIRVESHLVFQWTFTVLDGPPSWLPLVTFMLDPLCSFRYVIFEVSLLIVTNNDDTCTVHILILSYIKQDQIITEKFETLFPLFYYHRGKSMKSSEGRGVGIVNIIKILNFPTQDFHIFSYSQNKKGFKKIYFRLLLSLPYSLYMYDVF